MTNEPHDADVPDADPQQAPAAPVARRGWAVPAALASVLVVCSWGVLAASVMGSLAIGRRMLMNSEWALDFGRLPQPWMIAVGLVAVVISHRLFTWTMSRASHGTPVFGAATLAWFGVLGGVVYGAYSWQPPVVVGHKVGSASGQSTTWDAVAYVAYYARLWLPAAAALGLLIAMIGRRSPLRALAAGRRRSRQIKRERRRPVAMV